MNKDALTLEKEYSLYRMQVARPLRRRCCTTSTAYNKDALSLEKEYCMQVARPLRRRCCTTSTAHPCVNKDQGSRVADHA